MCNNGLTKCKFEACFIDIIHFMTFSRPLYWFIYFSSPFVGFTQSIKQASWQQKVDYSISVTLDDQNHKLRGFETMHYFNNSQDTLNELFIHLWPNAYKNKETAFAKQFLENGETAFYFSDEKDKGFIDSLDFLEDGKRCTWNFDELNQDLARIQLQKPLLPGAHCEISTPFLVKIPKVFSRLGHDGQTYNMTQWYPKPVVYDTNGWNPLPYLNQGEFYSEFGKYEVFISLPKNYIVAATGRLQNPEEINYKAYKGQDVSVVENIYCKTSLKTLHFIQDSIHDFAWFASKNFGIVTGSVNIGGREIETCVYSQKKEDLNARNLESIKTALVYYSENAGVYPYTHASVVKSELKAGGGMEYPMITVCDFLNREVIIHEVGHNWFYGILASNERRYPWMDESINSYFEAQAMKFSKSEWQQTKQQNLIDLASDFSLDLMAINAARQNSSQALGQASETFTDLNYGAIVYGKGSYIFKHLRDFLGQELFKKCFKTYYETWKFKHPLPADMQTVFEEVSGQKLDWFFQTQIQSDFKFDFKITKLKMAPGSDSLKVYTNSVMPTPIGYYDQDKVLKMGWTKNGEISFAGNAGSFRNVKIILDPNKSVFDINRKNNIYSSGSLLKRWPTPSVKLLTRPDVNPKRDLYVLPALGFNIHNGLMLGAGLHNWAIPVKKLEYMIMPLFAFSTQTLNGYANFNYKLTPLNYFQTIDLGLKNASFNYTPIKENYTYYRSIGYLHFLFKPKNLRSPIRNMVEIEYSNIAARWLKKATETPDSTQQKSWFQTNIAPIDYHFARLVFIHQNKRVINPYQFRAFIESGKYKNNKSDYYFKPGLEVTFLKTFGKKNRGLSLRAFAGNFISNGKADNGLFMYRLGSKNGEFDYGMEHTLAGRGANTVVWQNAITPGDDHMKLKGNLGNFLKGFLTINVSSHLPGKIPFRPYADFCLMQKSAITDKNGKEVPMIYSAGIALDIIPESFIIYFPLSQSVALNDMQANQRIHSFGNRICFSLILNDLEPHRLFKRVKLF